MVDSEKLPLAFYQQENVTLIARELLGKILWTNVQGMVSAGKIVETEAYSFKEKACHAFNNKRTNRTETLFAPGGTVYIYLCYGIHHLFNVVTNKEDVAEAVLIRAVEPVIGLDLMRNRRGGDLAERQLTSGPGKLSAALGITKARNGIDLSGSEIWITDGPLLPEDEIITDVRIGVDYAEEDAELPWRYMVRDNPYVSVLPKS